MRHLCSHSLLVVLLVSVVEAYIVSPFQVALSNGTSRMNDLVRNSRVPSLLPPLTLAASPTPGIDDQWLHALQKAWLEEFNWENRQAYINR
jgi:Epoxide hydrolase N terminus